MTVHLVCRDCEAEGLHDDLAEAGQLASNHADMNDHEVVIQKVDDE